MFCLRLNPSPPKKLGIRVYNCSVKKKVVFFDVDDTLIDHTGASHKSLLSTRNLLLPNASQEEFETVWKEETNKFWKLFTDKKLTFEQQRIKRIQAIWKHFGKKISKEEADKVFATFLRFYESDWRLFYGLKKSLHTLKANGIRLGIISNGNRMQQDKKLKKTGVFELFEGELIIVSEEIGHAKPNPKIFKHAQKKAGVKIDELIFFGNDLLQDIEPSKKIGWENVLVDSPKKITGWVLTNFH
jgi:putative hydrolase of the HAD superfamily